MHECDNVSLNEVDVLMSQPLKKIALAAVLKPIDDTRMFEKFAQALCSHYEVHIIGYESQEETKAATNLKFYPIFKFSRNESARLQANQAFLHQLKQIQPDLLIVHAVELLPSACWYAWKYNSILCYDVRENYWRNIMYQQHYASWLKWPLALAIRSIEWMSRWLVDHYFLAERCYAQEFNFANRRYSILENKYQRLPIDVVDRPNSPLRFIYTGTISTIYGAQEAFILMEKLVDIGVDLEFQMMGKVAEEPLGNWLSKQADRCKWFHWQGELQPVSHQKIIQTLANSDVALLPYQANLSTQNCIPTKLYECLALSIPMLIQHNSLWEQICAPHQAALFIDFPTANPRDVQAQLATSSFYPKGAVQEAFWQDETLLETIQRLMA